MDYDKTIENYIDDILDLDCSPFELHHSLFTRSELEKEYKLLSDKQKQKLAKADLLLIQRAQLLHDHLSQIHNFKTSPYPLPHFWWHLDKIIDGSLRFKSVKTV